MYAGFRRSVVVASLLGGSIVAGVTALASPAGAAPALSLTRIIRTHPFVGTSTSIRDNEGLAYVPVNNTLWIIDDSTGQAYAVNRTTGVLGQVITKSNFANSKRFGGTELAGSSRAGDLEAAAYDPGADQLYFFSGTCCTSSEKPTVFRLSRASTSGAFAIDSWQPLNAPYNDLSGVGFRNGEIWAGYLKILFHYDYVTNTASSARTLPGSSNIYGVGFNASGSEVWIAESGDRVKKYDFASNTLVSGYTYAMSGLGVRDARAVEIIGNELYISDGYDYYGSDPDAWGVRVYSLGGVAVQQPVASFTKSATSGTAPLTVNFTDTSTNTPTSWLWTFGDGTTSTLQNPSHVYSANGTFNVTLKATNTGGSNTSGAQSITVTAAVVTPVASFTKSASSGTAPLTVNFTDTSTNTPTSWLWTFGDGSTSTTRNPSHTYTGTGGFDVTLRATNTAGGNTSPLQTVTVSPGVPMPVASFTADATSGVDPLTVTFTDTSTNTPTSWSWTFGDGATSTAQNPSHVYAAGSYTAKLTATNIGGGTSATQTITVTSAPAAPVASFTKSASSGTFPLTVDFTDTSTNTPTSWSWDFGDGATSTAQNPSHDYTGAGSFVVSLTATNAIGGNTSATQTVVVSAPGAGGTVTLIASEDAYVTQASPTATHASSVQLYNTFSTTAMLRSYLKFAVTGVSGTVTQATLRLFVTDTTDNGAPWYRIADNSWSDATLNWNNAPAPVGTLAGDPGVVTSGVWLELDVTSIVTGNGTYSFASAPTSTNSEKFSSKEAANPPQLVITTA